MHQFLLSAAGILACSALVPRLRDQRVLAAGAGVLFVLASVGLVVLPEWGALWATIAGFAGRFTIVLSLPFFGLRTTDHSHAAALFGMAQSIGYLLAAVGPIAVGAPHGATGSWTPALAVLIAVIGALVLAGLFAGRDRVISDPTSARPSPALRQDPQLRAGRPTTALASKVHDRPRRDHAVQPRHELALPARPTSQHATVDASPSLPSGGALSAADGRLAPMNGAEGAATLGTTGSWQVATETSTYLIDLDEKTCIRIPDAGQGALPHLAPTQVAALRRDHEAIALLMTPIAELGSPLILALDVRRDGTVTFRQSTVVRDIRALRLCA